MKNFNLNSRDLPKAALAVLFGLVLVALLRARVQNRWLVAGVSTGIAGLAAEFVVG